MRRYFYLAILLAAGVLVSSCNWGIQIYQPTAPTIFVVNQNTERLEVGPEAQEQVVYISSDLLWYATLKDGSWCTLGDQSYYNEFTTILSFSVKVNDKMESRTDSLIVISGTETRKIAIVQNGIGSLLNTNEITLHGTIPVQYKLNAKGAWTAETSDGWFSVSPDKYSTGNIITFTALSKNIDTQSRTGSVTFKLSGIELTVPVKQEITETIIVESKTKELVSAGGPFTITTLTNVDYRVSTDVDWIHILGTRALLGFVEQFNADPNLGTEARIGHITFAYGDEVEVVTVTQAAKDPILSISTPGFYGINGRDYIYRKGLCQTGRITRGGSRSFRMMSPSDICVVQLSGLPLSLTSGETIQAALTIHKDGILKYSQQVNVKVMGEDDKLIWLKNSDNTYFILKKQ